MRALLFVGLGGFVGAILRYSVSLALVRAGRGTVRGVPLATLTVNVVGCLAVGWFLASLAPPPPGGTLPRATDELRLAVGVGLLGALTTYSTFGYETVVLVRAGAHGAALASIGLHLALGLGAVALGLRLGTPG